MHPIPRFILRVCILLLGAGLLTGCQPPRPRQDVAHPDMSVKIPSMVRAVEAGDSSAIPLLVRELDSTDPAIRFYAIEALYRLTGERFGYDYSGDETTREPALERWRRWLETRAEH